MLSKPCGVANKSAAGFPAAIFLSFGVEVQIMSSIYYAYFDSRNFSFDAIGKTKQDAISALTAGLNAHAEQYGLDKDWVDVDEEIYVRQIQFGAAYRDRDLIRG
jgi:hypothetical protein